MNLIHVDEINIEDNRQRSDMSDKKVIEHVTELATEISQKQLLHPVVLRSETDKTLVAGECRVTAVSLLNDLGLGIRFNGQKVEAGWIPYTVLGDLDEVAYEEAELAENLNRMDLTWQQETEALARLHRLREKQNGVSGQSFVETAKEVTKSDDPVCTVIEKVSDSVKLIDHLDDPDVAKAKTQKEALKVVKRKQKEAEIKELADEFEAADNPHTLHADDCRTVLAGLDDGSIDIILTDPPYGIDMHKGTSWDGDSHDYDDSVERLGELFEFLPSEWYRVCGEKSHAFVFCDYSKFEYLKTVMAKAGWLVWPKPLIWYKGNSGSYPNPERGFRYTYECILFANKGLRETHGLSHDVISINQIQNQDHPAGKPPKLYSKLLSFSAVPGDVVLDCFAGGGPIFPAATANNCVAIGCEINPKYHALAKLRMDKTIEDEE